MYVLSWLITWFWNIITFKTHTGYDDKTKRRSQDEHPCSKEVRRNAHCNDLIAISFYNKVHIVLDSQDDNNMNIMIQGCLDNFRNQNQFWYVSKDADESEKGVQRSDKWWLPTVKVPPEGLSEESRKWMQYQKDCVNQVLKASMAINAEILAEMEIPENYIDTLPKVTLIGSNFNPRIWKPANSGYMWSKCRKLADRRCV